MLMAVRGKAAFGFGLRKGDLYMETLHVLCDLYIRMLRRFSLLLESDTSDTCLPRALSSLLLALHLSPATCRYPPCQSTLHTTDLCTLSNLVGDSDHHIKMLFTSLLCSTLLASCSVASLVPAVEKRAVHNNDLVERQSQAFVPTQSSGRGQTCAAAFGAGYLQCGTGSECVNPAQGDTCCSEGCK